MNNINLFLILIIILCLTHIFSTIEIYNKIEPMGNDVDFSYGINSVSIINGKIGEIDYHLISSIIIPEREELEKMRTIKLDELNLFGLPFRIGLISEDDLLKLYKSRFGNINNKQSLDRDILCLLDEKPDRFKTCKFPHEWTIVRKQETMIDKDYNIMKPLMLAFNVQLNEFMIPAITTEGIIGAPLYIENDVIKIGKKNIDNKKTKNGSILFIKNKDQYIICFNDNGIKKYIGTNNNLTYNILSGFTPNSPKLTMKQLKTYIDINNKNILKFSIISNFETIYKKNKLIKEYLQNSS